MPEHYELRGYGVRYFPGTGEFNPADIDNLHTLTKRVHKFVKRNKHLHFESVSIDWNGEEIGWTATIVYIGFPGEDAIVYED